MTQLDPQGGAASGATLEGDGDGRSTSLMPAAFFGHGHPRNALFGDRYTAAWRAFGR